MKLNKGEGKWSPPSGKSVSITHCRILSVFFTLQDAVTFTETTGSSTAISQSYFTATQSLEVDFGHPPPRLYTVGLVARCVLTLYTSPVELATLHGLLDLVAPSRKVLVAALSATLYQCGPTLGAKSLSPILL